MRITMCRLSLLLTVSTALCCADTVTRRDHSSVNGAITGIAAGKLKLVARFRSKALPVEIDIPLNEIEIIEFNTSTYNSGAPPTVVGFSPEATQTKQNAVSAPATDVVVYKAGGTSMCTVVSVDENYIQCGEPGSKGSEHINRATVLRILLSAR